MSYMEKIDKIYNKYVKDFKRKDETFNMMCIKGLVKKIESGDYDKEIINMSEENIDAMLKFLYQEYLENMYKWYEYLNSDEYKNKNIYC